MEHQYPVTVDGITREAEPDELAAILERATPSVDEARQRQLAALAAVRYEHEVGGCLVAGVEVRTDRESQALLTGAALAAMLDPGYTVAWKTVTGWVTLDATAIVGLASSVRGHVQSCFDRERALAAAIEAAIDVEAVGAVDITTGWPTVG